MTIIRVLIVKVITNSKGYQIWYHMCISKSKSSSKYLRLIARKCFANSCEMWTKTSWEFHKIRNFSLQLFSFPGQNGLNLSWTFQKPGHKYCREVVCCRGKAVGVCCRRAPASRAVAGPDAAAASCHSMHNGFDESIPLLLDGPGMTG